MARRSRGIPGRCLEVRLVAAYSHLPMALVLGQKGG